jgi:hypothetical protein
MVHPVYEGEPEQVIRGTATPPVINATAEAHTIESYCGTRTTPCHAAVVIMKASRQNQPVRGFSSCTRTR